MLVESRRDGTSVIDELLAALQDVNCSEDANLGDLLQNFLRISALMEYNVSSCNIFTKGAMFVQSSTVVYSRKVDVLHRLMLEMLQALKRKENQKDTNKGEKVTEEKIVDVNTLEIAKNIELKNDGSKSKPIKFLPNIPVELLTLEDAEKGNEFLSNSKGENVGNIKDFSLFTYQQLPTTMLVNKWILKRFLQEGLQNKDWSNASQHLLPAEEIIENDDIFEPAVDHQSSDGEDAMVNPNEPERIELRSRKQSCTNSKNPSKSKTDPWTILNPHEEIPNHNQAPKQVKWQKQRRNGEKSVLCPVSEFISDAYHSHATKFPKRSDLLPNNSCFNNLFYDEYKARQLLGGNEKLDVGAVCEEDEGIADSPGMGINDDLDTGEPFDENQDADNFLAGNNLFEMDLIDDGRGESPLDDTVLASYEELVKRHVARYMESAARYIQTPELTKRVREWEKKILPILAAEEQREPFNIHTYGFKVLDKFNNNNRKETIQFLEMVKDLQPPEKARILLATLQLANDYNVQIGECGESNREIEITLLTRKRPQERMMEDALLPRRSNK